VGGGLRSGARFSALADILVDFQYFDPQFQPEVEIKCDVLECGAIDIPNCLTFGSFYAQ
jgi:hypothetical protein